MLGWPQGGRRAGAFGRGGTAPLWPMAGRERGLQDAHVLQVLVLLGISVVVLTLLARTMRVAPPVVLLIGGVGLICPALFGPRLFG